MSWSVYALGRVAAVKVALTSQFNNARFSTSHIKHEAESVDLIEKVVNGQLDYLAEASHATVVEVKASGSAYGSESADGKKTRSSNTSMEVKIIPGFVE